MAVFPAWSYVQKADKGNKISVFESSYELLPSALLPTIERAVRDLLPDEEGSSVLKRNFILLSTRLLCDMEDDARAVSVFCGLLITIMTTHRLDEGPNGPVPLTGWRGGYFTRHIPLIWREKRGKLLSAMTHPDRQALRTLRVAIRLRRSTMSARRRRRLELASNRKEVALGLRTILGVAGAGCSDRLRSDTSNLSKVRGTAAAKSSPGLFTFAKTYEASIDWLLDGDGGSIGTRLSRPEGKIAVLPVAGPMHRRGH